MTKEEEVQQQLLKSFSFLEGKIRIQRVRRIFVDVPTDKFEEVLKFLMNKVNFNILCTMTGVDDGSTLGFIYHLTRTDGIVINVKISVPKDNPKIKTIIGYFPAAVIYEREVVDLLGAKVEGLPEGSRYPLPDGWPEGQYPLRKDWKSDVLKK
ncbi:MAG: NADH-quinone oxidoreductase subunit C [Elusimicrobia bacterium]|nr:NADH-quinone oxidoreductase subunit C [Elusimicrobiota bacterium]